MANVAQVQELIEPAVTALGYELWGVQLLSQGRHSTLRIFIDKPEGINIDDCAAVSHQVSGILDVEDPIKSQYTLEVSSPGIDRPLFKLEQYQRYVGEGIALRLRTPVAGRRKFSGLLKAVEADNIIVRVEEENEEYVLPFESIDKANIVSKDFS